MNSGDVSAYFARGEDGKIIALNNYLINVVAYVYSTYVIFMIDVTTLPSI